MESMIGVKNRLKQDIIGMRILAQEIREGNFQPKPDTNNMLDRVITELEQNLRDLKVRFPD